MTRVSGGGRLPDPDEYERVKLLRYAEAGDLLGCSAATVKRLVDEGEIRVISYHAITRIPLDELRAFVDRRRAAARFTIRRRAPRKRPA